MKIAQILGCTAVMLGSTGALADTCPCAAQIQQIQQNQTKIVALLAQHSVALSQMQAHLLADIKQELDNMERQITQQIQYPLRDTHNDLAVFKKEMEKKFFGAKAALTAVPV